MKLAHGLVFVIFAMACSSIAHAVPIIVHSEADFLSLVDDVTREGFEGFPTDSGCSNGGSSPATTVTTADFSVTTNPQDGGTSFLCLGTAGWPGPTEGNNALIAGSNTGDTWMLDFLFEEAIVGIYIELTDAVERGDAFLLLGGADPILVAAQGSGGLDIVYFGIIFDDPTTSFSLQNTGFFDGWGIDNVIYAPVPEPGTLALFVIGLAGLAIRRRRPA